MMNRAEIDERFFNFSPEVRDTIDRFQHGGDPALIDPVLHGVLHKYLPENTPAAAPLNVFGLESLTMIEVILDLQDALGIHLTDEELRGMRNLDEARALLVAKARERARPDSQPGEGPHIPPPAQ